MKRSLGNFLVYCAAAMFLVVLDLSLALEADLQASPSLQEVVSAAMPSSRGDSGAEAVEFQYRFLRGRSLAVDCHRLVLVVSQKSNPPSQIRYAKDRVLYGHLFKVLMVTNEFSFPEDALDIASASPLIAFAESDPAIGGALPQDYHPSDLINRLGVAPAISHQEVLVNWLRLLYNYAAFLLFVILLGFIIGRIRRQLPTGRFRRGHQLSGDRDAT